MRKILHVDMDAFYAAAEIRRRAELYKKAVIVGGKSRRGVVCSCSYEARAYGVRAGMPNYRALERCPHAVVLPVDMEYYRTISQQLQKIFERYSNCIEPLSLDEAYLLLPQEKSLAFPVAQEIQTTVLEELSLSCSIGVSYNKFLAKMASDYRKPYGITVITPEQAQPFLAKIPIEKFYGVGSSLNQFFQRHEIKNGAHLHQKTLNFLLQHLGKQGYFLYQVVRGIDIRPVQMPTQAKSLSQEITFSYDLDKWQDWQKAADQLIKSLVNSMQDKKIQCRNLSLKVRYPNFQHRSRSQRFAEYTSNWQEIRGMAQRLLYELYLQRPRIRLLGISCSQLLKGYNQPYLPWKESL